MTRLQVYLRPPEHSTFVELARANGLAPSRFARRLLVSALRSSNSGKTASDRTTGADRQHPAARGRQVGIRVSEALFAALEATAIDYGQTPSGWTAALLAHTLLIDVPLQRRDELVALREATRQLWAVGVLLNQIARVLHTQVKSNGHADARSVPLDLIEQCKAEIRSTTGAAHALMDSNRQAYRYYDLADSGRHVEAEHA
jgi:hypothetical protein